MSERMSDRVRSAIWGFLWLHVLTAASGIILLAVFRGENAVQAATAFRASQESAVWSTLAGIHYWGSFAVLVVGPIILSVLFLQGIKGESRKLWLPVLFSLLAALALQITGNALPADRHDVRTVNVEASIASRAPVVGEALGRIALQGNEFTNATLDFWRNMHIALGSGTLLVLLWLFIALRSRAPKSGFELGVSASFPLATIVASIAIPRASGTPFEDADRASYIAQPSWYVMPMHALLKLFESINKSVGWIGAMLLPGIITLAAALAPWWAPKLHASARKVVLFSALAGLGLLLGFYGSAPAPISGIQPVTELASGKAGGPIAKVLSAHGAKLYEEHCSGCHGKGGAGSPGAPKLTEIHRVNSDPNFYIEFIRDPKSVNPSSTMPAFSHLADEDLRALAEWLRDPHKE